MPEPRSVEGRIVGKIFRRNNEGRISGGLSPGGREGRDNGSRDGDRQGDGGECCDRDGGKGWDNGFRSSDRQGDGGEISAARRQITATFKVGAISLAFMIIGYEAALFVHRASVLRIQERRDHPDTVLVYVPPREGFPSSGAPAASASPGKQAASQSTDSGATAAGGKSNGWDSANNHRESANNRRSSGSATDPSPKETSRTPAEYSSKKNTRPPAVEAVRRNTRRVESFRFNPNTVSVEDLQRLGFSAKQAASIDNYRTKGGRFRRPSDFGKSFVVADSVFRRLKPFIDIPRVDINAADSAAFDSLPGIGAWTAAEMVRYRKALGGYSCCEQLMDVYRFDRSRYEAVADLICCGPGAKPFDLWGLPAEELSAHPCIRTWSVARAIVLYRNNTPPSQWTVAGLHDAGILDSLAAARLERCLLVPVPDSR